MGGFWTNSSPSTPTPTTVPPPGDSTDSVSVKPAPSPVKALTTPFPTQWLGEDGRETPDTTSTPPPTTEPGSTTASPKVEPSPLPKLPFVPSPDRNPDLTGSPRFKPDPSSILLSYPRSNVDHTHDFYDIYNPPEKGLWSIGSADDPLLWGAMPWKCYKDPTKTVRYALGAQELCYPNKHVGSFFKFGQIVPVIRGNGIFQPAIDKSIDLLRSGKWVHIFPEGKINQTDQLIRLKWGVGRILMEYGGPTLAMGGKPMDQTEMPIVIPIYHLGMEDILRLYPNNDSPIFPKLGMPLTIVFGEPIDFTSLMQEYKEGKLQEVEARVKITERVFDAMEELRLVALRLQKEQAERSEQDRIKKGHWWWIQPAGWGWWRPHDVKLDIKHRDTSVKIEEH
ncbi:hypothetical protein BGX27_011198 [Mortierella sp. AM989]|nr:hypothetical protein BGX27_011198 [Mortierella sp. AM989]